LNYIVVSARLAFQNHIDTPLLNDIINMMDMLGPNPKGNDAFIQVVELIGNRFEKMKRHAKACNFGEQNPRKTPQKKAKR
jgi:hypothetical protein